MTSGQTNPIQNLSFSGWYVTPNNCYELSWSPPVASATDTLVGYNIYQNNSFYRFTTSLSQQCIPCLGDTASAYCNSFMSFNMGYFYIHVTAVYNFSNIESTYDDSAHFDGLATNIVETKNQNSCSISPNPFITQTILSSSGVFSNATLTLYNMLGQQVHRVSNLTGRTIVLQRDNLATGFYLMRLIQDNKIIATEKLIITD